MKHSPQIALDAARRELSLAREVCPHWDQESDGEGHDCCYRVDDAKRALEKARRGAP